MLNGMDDVAFAAGIVLGSFLILSVCWVWLTKQTFGMSGASMCVFGVALVGLTVWRTISIEATADGIKAEFERELRELNEDVEQVAELSREATQGVLSLARAVEVNSEQFIELTRVLEQRSAVGTESLETIRERVAQPPVARGELETRINELELNSGRLAPGPP